LPTGGEKNLPAVSPALQSDYWHVRCNLLEAEATDMRKYAFAWLLGVPVSVLAAVWVITHLF
jgi:hypothetical protein